MIVIPMNEIHSGDTKQIELVAGGKVVANISLDNGSIVSFAFNGSDWNEAKARKWIKNKGINEIMYRKHKDGSVMINTIRMSSSPVSLMTGEAEKILGSEVYMKLMKIESSHGSDKPFLVNNLAMDFKGEDFIVGNGLRFDRKKTIRMIDKFGGLPIYPGHIGFFEGHKEPIGNTVSPYVDEAGNPANYMYIYPHGNGKVYRENLRIAEAQGLLKNYPVSMAGRPIKMKILDEEELKECGFKFHAEVNEWEPKTMDIVIEPALEGSGPVSIVNQLISDDGRRHKMDGSMSEILAALSDHSVIALSDLMKVDAVKKAIESYVEERISVSNNTILNDEKISIIMASKLPKDKLASLDLVKSIVDESIKSKLEQIELTRDMVTKVAANSKIELSKTQELFLRGNIKDAMSEQDVLRMITKEKETGNLDKVNEFTLEHKDAESLDGVVITEVTLEEVMKHI